MSRRLFDTPVLIQLQLDEQCTPGEIASVLGFSESAVRTRLHEMERRGLVRSFLKPIGVKGRDVRVYEAAPDA